MAPKITSVVGATGRRSSPSTRGFGCLLDRAHRALLHRMPAELVAQRREHAVGVVAVAARGEARVQRGGDRGRGDVARRRLLDRPAALAGVLGVAGERVQVVAVGFERAGGQFAQPRAHHRALSPEVGDLRVVQLVLALVEQVEALRVGLHQAVLHAVVHHLHEVPGAGGPEVLPPARADRGDARLVGRRRQHVEERREAFHRPVRAADHHAVADFEAPHPAGGAHVDVVDAAFFELPGAQLVFGPLGVAAVHDRVVAIQQLGELVDRLLRDLAGGQHQPHRARRLQALDEVGQRGGADGAVGLRPAAPRRGWRRTPPPDARSRAGCGATCRPPSCPCR